MLTQSGAAARSASVANLPVLTKAGAAARLALMSLLPVLTKSGAAARPANLAILAVLANAAAAARRAPEAFLVVDAEGGAAARRAFGAVLVVRTLLDNAPPDWVRRRGVGRCCRGCCGCLRLNVAARTYSELAGCLLIGAWVIPKRLWTQVPTPRSHSVLFGPIRSHSVPFGPPSSELLRARALPAAGLSC